MNAIDFNYQRLMNHIEGYMDTYNMTQPPILLMNNDTYKIFTKEKSTCFDYDCRVAIDNSLPLGEVELVS